MTPAQFRAAFPEFANTTAYPDPAIEFQITLAEKRLPEDRWDDLLEHGTGLFTAHFLTLNARNAKSGGAVLMPVASKAVDKVSVSYDTTMATLADGGHWNSTSYGVQFLQLARMVGAGGVQL